MGEPLETAKKQRGRPFAKGQSGNPSGRPKKTPELVEIEQLCRELSPDAVQRLADWMRSDNARASVAACGAIMERGFGKPVQPTENKTEMTIRDAIDRPPAETREQWLARRERELATTPVAGHADD